MMELGRFFKVRPRDIGYGLFLGLLGGLFIGVVVLFPDGLAGGWHWWCKRGWPWVLARCKPGLRQSEGAEIATMVAKGKNP